MAVSNEPIFVQASCLAQVQVSTANTALDGSGTLGTLLTGDGDGTIVALVWAKCKEATGAANMIRLFLSTDGGSNKHLIAEIAIAAATSSATVKTGEGYWKPIAPLVLKDANCILYASTHTGDDTNVSAWGGNY